MLRRLTLKNVVIVTELEIEFGTGFTALTGETGAGKSILVDALQLALGNRADAGVVREGTARAEIGAEFDSPPGLQAWLDEAGFESADALLLRRTVDSQGRSRAWINGSPATVAQLREAADHLVDIHGQHAWQSLTRPAAVRQMLDAHAGIDTQPLAAAHAGWRAAVAALADARQRQGTLEQERERLQWQIGELARLAPRSGEWDEINTEHRRLAHAQALLDAARTALDAVADGEPAAQALTARALDSLEAVAEMDPELAGIAQVLREAQALLDDAAHTLSGVLGHREPDPDRLAVLDARLSAWITLARRYRQPPEALPACLETWQADLRALDAATDLGALERAVEATRAAWQAEARRVSRLRQQAVGPLGKAVTQAMQTLGMTGGRFEVALLPEDEPQPHGAENVEFRVAGHAGSTPRPLAKVASGGELSRLALAIAATAAQRRTRTAADGAPQTLIFDEIDTGVGGDVAHAVGRLMKQLGGHVQVLAVTHLAQVAACADGHLVVAKSATRQGTVSEVRPVAGEARVAEVARMLGGGHLEATSRAHAQALLEESR